MTDPQPVPSNPTPDPDKAVPCNHGSRWAGDVLRPCLHPDCVARVLAPGEAPPAPEPCAICQDATHRTGDHNAVTDRDAGDAEARCVRCGSGITSLRPEVPMFVCGRESGRHATGEFPACDLIAQLRAEVDEAAAMRDYFENDRDKLRAEVEKGAMALGSVYGDVRMLTAERDQWMESCNEARAEVAAMRPVVNALVRFADDQWKFAGHIPDTWIGVRDAIRRCEHLDDEAGTETPDLTPKQIDEQRGFKPDCLSTCDWRGCVIHDPKCPNAKGRP